MKQFINSLVEIIKKIIKTIKQDKIKFVSLFFIKLFVSLLTLIIVLIIVSLPMNDSLIYLIKILFPICFLLGIDIGYNKIILNYIDSKNINLFDLSRYFYLLPKMIVLYFCYLAIPIILITYIVFMISNNDGVSLYNILVNSNNPILQNTAEASIAYNIQDWNIDNWYVSSTNMIIILILSIALVAFLCKFWTIKIILIDKNCSINHAFKYSYQINNKSSLRLIITFLLTYLVLMIFSDSIDLIFKNWHGFIFILLIISSIIFDLFWIVYYRKLANIN